MMLSGLGAATTVTPGVATIASTIQTVEGYSGPSAQYPNGTLAYQNNNPGNLIFANQPGATQGAGGFAAFPSYQAGYDALVNQIGIYSSQGLTIDQMMNKYAPALNADGTPSGNNPTQYANQIATALGVSPTTSIADAIGTTTGASPGVDLTGAGIDSIAGDTTDDGSILGMDPTTLLTLALAGAAVLYFS